LEEDCRDVVSDDLDGDGRTDLLVTTFEVWPRAKQTLYVYRNGLDDGGNWLGFHFRNAAPGGSPIGARVTLHYAGTTTSRCVVVGDSYRSQHANALHFGLGGIDRVDSAEIRWINGEKLLLREPAINRYHSVAPPSHSGSQ